MIKILNKQELHLNLLLNNSLFHNHIVSFDSFKRTDSQESCVPISAREFLVQKTKPEYFSAVCLHNGRENEHVENTMILEYF